MHTYSINHPIINSSWPSLAFTTTEVSDDDPHVLTCILPGLDVSNGFQYQQYNKIAAQPSQFPWGPGGVQLLKIGAHKHMHLNLKHINNGNLVQ
jgi:hypothetical protein